MSSTALVQRVVQRPLAADKKGIDLIKQVIEGLKESHSASKTMGRNLGEVSVIIQYCIRSIQAY